MNRNIGIVALLLVSCLVCGPTKAQPEQFSNLRKAYGSAKQFCCEGWFGCISGPKDGSKVCKELGGTPFTKRYCETLDGIRRQCIDP